MNSGKLPTSRPVMNSPADEAEARDRANAAPRQADPDAPCRGETGVSSGSEARPVTATEHKSDVVEPDEAWAKAMGELASAAKKAHKLGKKCNFDVQTNVSVKPLKTTKKKAAK